MEFDYTALFITNIFMQASYWWREGGRLYGGFVHLYIM